MAFADVPAFLTCLHTRQSVAALALEFAVLTVAGTNEVLGAKWGEIDAENGVWTVPACRMKGGRAHRVPLSRRAAAILAELAKAKAGDFIFPGQQPGRHISSLEIIMARMKVDATVHGFRSSFSDWASETTNFPREVIEHCLAHLVGSNVERSYRRSTKSLKTSFVVAFALSHAGQPRGVTEKHLSTQRGLKRAAFGMRRMAPPAWCQKNWSSLTTRTRFKPCSIRGKSLIQTSDSRKRKPPNYGRCAVARMETNGEERKSSTIGSLGMRQNAPIGCVG